MISDISELTLTDLFSKSIIDYENRPAFSLTGKTSVTYGEVSQKVEKLIEIFNRYGLDEGDKISILGHNMPNWPISYFAVTTSSRVVVPILPDFTAFEIVNILQHSESKALIVSKRLQYKIPKHIYNELNLIISMDDFEIIQSSEKEKEVITSTPHPDDLAAIIYTSGTTGTSKGVMLSHRNLVSHEYMANRLFEIKKEDVFLS
ncbi:MAG TPA: AMP-binding protein, partial [Bacteroidales bacterium]|nr:AMP-binding protein [Bacteroidales bacterium]